MKRFWNKLVSRKQLERDGHESRPQRARCTPKVEQLEERLVPTILFQPQWGAEQRVPTSGPVLSSTPVYLIFEGIYWNNVPRNRFGLARSITARDVINSATTILASNFLQGTKQYGSDGQAYLAGTIFDASLPIATLVQQQQDIFGQRGLIAAVQKNIVNQLRSPSAQALYLVVPPPNTKDTYNLNFIGWHGELSHTFTYQIPIWRPFLPGATWVTIAQPAQVPFGWVGSFGTTRAQQVDGFSSVFSHELVEAITDSYTRTAPGVNVKPGSNWSAPNDPVDEIADYEPDGGGYFYRLGGTQVQAYWSDKRGGFVVPDGNSQVFTLKPQWVYNSADGLYYYHGQNILTINGDQMSDPNDTFTLATTAGGWVQVTLNGQTATFDPGQIQSVIVNAGMGNDVVNVESWNSAIPLTLNVNQGSDIVNFAPTNGRMDPVQGSIHITGNGQTVINVDDQNTADRNPLRHHVVSYTIDNQTLTRIDHIESTDPTTPSRGVYDVVQITFSGVSQITVNGGATGNYFDVQGLLDQTLVLNTGAGQNTIHVGSPDGSLDSVVGELDIHGNGSDALILDDHGVADRDGFTNQVVYTISSDHVLRQNVFSFQAGDGPLVFEYATTIGYDSIGSVTIESGAEATSHVYVDSLLAGTDLVIEAGTGATSVQVRLDGLGGTLQIVGNPAGTTTVSLDDSNNASPMEYDLTANSVGWEPLGSDPAAAQVSFSDLTQLFLLGGTGGNTIRVFDLPSVPMWLDGGAGNNTLDYSAYTGDVVVDLSLGRATGFLGIVDIQNVTGSIGNDVLVGDANPNVLIGGTGRNVIIGGSGADQIFGGGDDNILIDGTTAYDFDLDALQAIAAVWNRTDLAFQDRVNILSDAEFSEPLTVNTVFAGSGAATVEDGQGQDWLLPGM